MKSNNLRLVGYPTLLLAMAFMLYMFYLVIFPLKTATAIRQPFLVLTPRVSEGGTLKYEVALCKYNNAQGTITRQLVGPEYRFLNSEPSNIPVGCNTAIRDVQMPSDLTPGTYTILITTKYTLNFLHSTTNSFKTEQFEIYNPSSTPVTINK